jgi:hypothetical protein
MLRWFPSSKTLLRVSHAVTPRCKFVTIKPLAQEDPKVLQIMQLNQKIKIPRFMPPGIHKVTYANQQISS